MLLTTLVLEVQLPYQRKNIEIQFICSPQISKHRIIVSGDQYTHQHL